MTDPLHPHFGPDDEIRIAESHRPVLHPGDYEVTFSHTFGDTDNGDQPWVDGSRKQAFSIFGPRFSLDPGDIASRFPPKDVVGPFTNVLPHIVFSRTTLPWERSAQPGDAPDPAPWLAVIVVSETEWTGGEASARTSTLRELQASTHFSDPASEKFDDPEQSVSVLHLSDALKKRLLPTRDEITLLCHARDVEGSHHEQAAIAVAKRLPTPGERNHVHLVSVESLYDTNAGPTAATGPIDLVSLASWTFTCDAETEHGFVELLQRLDRRPLRLAVDPAGLTTGMTRRMHTGAIPVEHRRRDGTASAGWYRSPLCPIDDNAGTISSRLPARRAEDCLLVDADTGLTDVTYAAAWELGRVLALSDPTVSARLHRWHTEYTHAQRRELHDHEMPHHRVSTDRPPFDLDAWFESSLTLLGAVPFNYLVPDADMLPLESIRFFSVDRPWIDALHDGAFSMGRSTTELQRPSPLADPPDIRGMLLRSTVVDQWPDLLVDAYRSTDETAPARRLRVARLGPQVLLALYEAPVLRFDLHLHPQALHYGFDEDYAEPFHQEDRRPTRHRSRGPGAHRPHGEHRDAC